MSTSQTPLLSRISRILLPAAFFLLAALPAWSGPVLRIDEPVADFGERKTGEVVDHVFSIQNTGDERLRIRGIRTSCGCTTLRANSLEVATGETVDLPVRLDLHGRTGPQNQFDTFSTNDPEQRSVSLKISGLALAEISIEPRTLNLGQIDPENPGSGTVTLTSTTGEPFEVTRAVANKERIDISITPAPDRLSATLELKPKSGFGDGQFIDVLIFDTSNPNVQQERVLVMWQQYSGVTAAPSTMSLVLADRPQLLNRYIMVRGYPGLEEPLKVLGVEWPGQDQVEISFSDTGRFGWRVHFKDFEPVPGMAGSEILIKTNAEGFERIRIPVNLLQN